MARQLPIIPLVLLLFAWAFPVSLLSQATYTSSLFHFEENDLADQRLHGPLKSMTAKHFVKDFDGGSDELIEEGRLREYCQFNPQGNVLESVRYDRHSKPVISTRFQYDEQFRRIYSYMEELHADAPTRNKSMDYKYNASGQLVEILTTRGDGVIEGSTSFSYNGQGQLVEYCIRYFSDTTSHIRLKYNAAGKPIQIFERVKKFRRFNNVRFVYNADGELIKRFGYSVGGKWYLETLVEFSEDGGPLTSKWFDPKGVQTALRVFDEHENELSIDYLLHRNKVEYAYTYDSYGNWTERRLLSPPGVVNPSVLVVRDFEYYE